MSYPVFRSARDAMDSDNLTDGHGQNGSRGVGHRARGHFGRSSRGAALGSGSARNMTTPTLRNTISFIPNSTGTTAALSKTLKSITLTKISKLQKQRTSFARRKETILRAVDDLEHDQTARVKKLVAAVRDEDVPIPPEVDVMNILRWVNQSYVDTSVPLETLTGFEEQLRGQLDMQTRRLDLADLYSRLLKEWLSSSDVEADEPIMVEDDASLEGSFEVVEKDRVKQIREKFEAVVFTPLETDGDEIQVYLEGLFESENGIRALKRLRDVMCLHSFEGPPPFDEQALVWSLKGLLNNDLLRDDKKAILEEFLKDEVARGEICDVLNMQYLDLENWSWDAGEEGLPVRPRRQVNGKVRIMMDEDVLQAIFLHYIGMNWSASLKRTFTDVIRYTGIWSQEGHVSQDALDRRRYYLNDSTGYRFENLEDKRQTVFRDDFFLSQLPSAIWEGAGGYDGDEVEVEQGQTKRKSPKEIKQQLLRQLATELNVRQSLDGSAAIVQSDFQWFATSISHTTILEVLKFIHVPSAWITFLQKFLEAPLNLGPVSDNSDVPSEVRIRRRGIPMAHSLEKFFGELVLSFMDLAVNQEANTLLYRFHDDLWVVGQPDRCAKAWQSMKHFAKIMGLDFNMRKTGSVYLTSDGHPKNDEIKAILPKGAVSVGFLTLDEQSGDWIINDSEVDAHVTQLQKQLKVCSSVLSWVATWNSCIGRFFSHTFGEPANCFGRQHVDAILRTHKRIQEKIFDGKDGNGTSVTDYLKSVIAQRFGMTDVPDAFIYMPEQLGGLGVRNPFISGLLVRGNVYADPKERMQNFLKEEKLAYEKAKRDFEEEGDRSRRKLFHKIYTNEYGAETSRDTIHESELNKFFSMEEYTRYREALSSKLFSAFTDLMRTPMQSGVTISRNVMDALDEHAMLQPELNLGTMSEEMRWIIQQHSEELFERCGDLSMVDKSLLPLGILTILRKKKVSWQMVL